MLTIVLTVILIMGNGKKDIEQSHEIATIEQCFDAARAWMDQEPTKVGGVGLAAGCSSVLASHEGPPA